MKIGFGSDHAAFSAKENLKSLIVKHGIDATDVVDFGSHSSDSVDYPGIAQALCRAVLDGTVDRGILLCGSGIGMTIAANRFKGIRAALCHSVETAQLCREHNDANVLVMGARMLSEELMHDMMAMWLKTEFGGDRHQRRLDKIESGCC